jgi:aryl-alcohol dehydrogenase-like predicted oxidoreductase
VPLIIPKRNFGNTGILVSALGYGAGGIGSEDLSEKDVAKLLNTVVDEGINLIDTARGYGLSEERIGKHLSAKRRDDIILSTKVGYGIEGVPDWTYDAVYKGIDEARKLLQTDVIDIVHLHSCPAHVLHANEVIDALHQAKHNGKIRVAAYSGENEDLSEAIQTGRFDSIQTSVNVFDQRILYTMLPRAKERYMGCIAKRPLANAPWRFDDQPHGNYAEVYWQRMKTMDIDFGEDWSDVALRFTTFRFGVDSAIVGTTNANHLKENVATANKGRLDDEILYHLGKRFTDNDHNWVGQL